MMTEQLYGLPIARRLRERTAENVVALRGQGIIPRLAVVVATDSESTLWYVRSIAKHAQKASVDCEVIELGAEASADAIAQTLQTLADDPYVHGIILQTPLPAGVDTASLTELIPVSKDIDGANPQSLGRLSIGQRAFAPATAQAVIEILEHYQVPLAGERVTIIGRSAVVGKPVAQLLLQRDATVTICHSRSQDVASMTQESSVVIVAVGKIGLLTGKHINENSIVIDVGTNVDDEGALVGDVEIHSVQGRAKALTPVPGGVGTVTASLLVLQTTQAALEISSEDVEVQRQPRGAGVG